MMQRIYPINSYVSAPSGKKRVFAAFKRLFDICVSLSMMIVLLPVCLVVAVIVAIDTKSTPLFIQTRVGRGNRPFRMLKFRTMSPKTPQNVATYLLKDVDRYISKTGRLVRKLSLDELPQLWNIFKGDMSFVGPRPVVLTETELLALRTSNGASEVRPGLTGWAQVNGRDEVGIHEKAALDGYYANNISFKMDVRVLFTTVGYVLHSRGVAEGANPQIASETYWMDRSA